MQRSDAASSFEQLARATLDDLLERHPEAATDLGDHRFDDRLSDLRPEALEDERRAVFEERSRHIATGLAYLPGVARRLHHGRADVGCLHG